MFVSPQHSTAPSASTDELAAPAVAQRETTAPGQPVTPVRGVQCAPLALRTGATGSYAGAVAAAESGYTWVGPYATAAAGAESGYKWVGPYASAAESGYKWVGPYASAVESGYKWVGPYASAVESGYKWVGPYATAAPQLADA